MKPLMMRFWQDEHGVILSTEIVIVGSVLVVGLITGMVSLQKAVNSEMSDLGHAIGSLDQSYGFSGRHSRCGNCFVWTASSSFRDRSDDCDIPGNDIVPDDSRSAIVPESTDSPAGITRACRGETHDCCHHSSGEGTTGLCNSCSPCTGCGGSTGLTGVCGSCGAAVVTTGHTCGTGSRDVSTGVQGMRVTEWPAAPSGPHGCPDLIEAETNSCDREHSTCRLPEKKSFLNIPECVW